MKVTQKQQEVFKEAIQSLYEIYDELVLEEYTEKIIAKYTNICEERVDEQFNFSDIENAINLLSILKDRPCLTQEIKKEENTMKKNKALEIILIGNVILNAIAIIFSIIVFLINF